MTETEVQPQPDEQAQEQPVEAAPEQPEQAATEPGPVYCRWCGEQNEPTDDEDWLCSACERYQDSASCPTCHSVVRLAQLPDGAVPAAPRRRKVRE